MKPNRSIPRSAVIPVLIYPDVREAVAWLTGAFGFAERVQIGENHRSQLAFGDGAVIIGDVRNDRRPPRRGEVTHSVMVRVDAVDAHCERARSCGAKILMEPMDSNTVSGSTRPRTPRVTSGRSPRRSTMSLPRLGAASSTADARCFGCRVGRLLVPASHAGGVGPRPCSQRHLLAKASSVSQRFVT
ncbi:MAG: hypothetical protein QOK36_829 [Gaiellales bacterium]|jgi:uncharacterized glyoxalase superfamily protein PhnB|nr:hypothetical protein [Gaiellales bacterium]